MLKASIISIGNELLNGKTVDTNSAYLAQRCFNIGIEVIAGYAVGDDIENIAQKLKYAHLQSDIILVTGGLGPTDDDITRQAVAEFANKKLIFRQELFENLKAFFEMRSINMAQKNRSQAFLPDGARALENSLGTAPGFMLTIDQTTLFVMPGVPAEMKNMFENIILPRLRKIAGSAYMTNNTLRCFGAGESTIADMLGDMMARNRNPLINCTCGDGAITLHVIASDDDQQKAQQMAEKDINTLKNILGDLVYATGTCTMSQALAEELKIRKYTICTAESCTGGLIAKMLTDNPHSSEYFTQAFVTYSNQAKINLLTVPPDMIERYGAVSPQVAETMAINAAKIAGTDTAVSTTGIAGPTGASEQKPVGLVYIGIYVENKSYVQKHLFPGSRNSVRRRTALTALNMLRLKLRI